MTFEALSLPASERHQMCMSLLEEFGARNVTERGEEIVHSCLLPFGRHPNGDRNPSASINWEKLTYSCFVCGGGGLLWFIDTMRSGTGTSSPGKAREWLAEKTGIGGVQELGALLAYLDAVYEKRVHTVPVMPRYDAKILDNWRFIHPYLTEIRGISEGNLITHNVCWNPDENRIVIPHFWDGRLVGWQARRLGKEGPKYQSTPEFPKDRTLYNYDPSVADVVVVESPMTVIARTHQAHLEATFGAMVTTHQMEAIHRHRGRIILWFDNDEAGWWATEQVGEWMSQRGTVWAVDSHLDADPADLDDETFARMLDECVVPWVVWQRPDPGSLQEWKKVPHGVQEVRNGEGAVG